MTSEGVLQLDTKEMVLLSRQFSGSLVTLAGTSPTAERPVGSDMLES